MPVSYIIQCVAQFGYFLFLIAALIYVVTHRDRCPRPANLLTWALSLMLISQVTRVTIVFVMTKSLSVTQLAFGFQLLAVGSTLLSALVVVLIVKAVFADRPTLSPYAPRHDKGSHDDSGRPLVEQLSDNPYASPRQ